MTLSSNISVTYLVVDVFGEPDSHGILVALVELLELLEVLGTLTTHYGIAKFAWELDVQRPGQVRDLCCQHISWNHGGVGLVALFTPVTSRLVLHLLSALRAAVVDHFVINVDSLDESGDHIKLSLRLH